MEKPKLTKQTYDYSVMWWARLEYQKQHSVWSGLPVRKAQKWKTQWSGVSKNEEMLFGKLDRDLAVLLIAGTSKIFTQVNKKMAQDAKYNHGFLPVLNELAWQKPTPEHEKYVKFSPVLSIEAIQNFMVCWVQ